jgi:two-component system, OmpR family, alkaline phosphatase synthesis response regulator PhoP
MTAVPSPRERGEKMASARILAVDDSPTILEMIKAILESGGYEVITASDGAEALETARSEKPDLILLDVMLPKLDGYRVCRLLKFDQNYKDIPIIMLTAKTEEQAMATGIRTGANQYMTKPVEPDKLLAAVAEELAKA